MQIIINSRPIIVVLSKRHNKSKVGLVRCILLTIITKRTKYICIINQLFITLQRFYKHLMKKIISQVLNIIASPITKEFPFFFTFFLLFAGGLIGVPISLILNYDKIWAEGFIRLIGTLFVYDYLLTSIIYYANNKYLKFFLYFLILLLYGFNTFLYLNFDYKITPNVLLLMIETNSREASEFINLFAFSKSSIITYGKVILLIFVIIFLEYVYSRYVYKKGSHHKIKKALGLTALLMLLWGFSTFGPLYRICRHDTIDNLFQQQTMELFIPDDPISLSITSLRSLYLIGHEM